MLLLICCLLLLPLWESAIVICFVVRFFMSFLVLQSSWFVLLAFRDCCVPLPRSLFHGVGLSAVCDCDIS